MQQYETIISLRRQAIAQAVKDALAKAKAAGRLSFDTIPDFAVEKPREEAHGDFAVNAAMIMAKACHMAPRDIAKTIAEYIDFSGTDIAKMEIAGPGFINFRMQETWLAKVFQEIRAQGEDFGQSKVGQGEKIQVEFVSANPTGELHMGNARGAAIGDSLANLLSMAGWQVQREYYVNDAGNQIEKFSLTLNALYLQKLGHDVPFPEDGYHGADLPILIDGLIAEIGDSWLSLEEPLRKEKLADYALEKKITAIRQALLHFGVRYDNWFSERSLHDSGKVKEVIETLQEKGWLIQKDGALWLDCSRMDIDKDMKPEVLVRANGIPTYYAADIAYHDNKFQRGFAKVIDIWGADHHGHVARMKGAMEALGYNRDQLEVMLMQFVRLYQGGELVKMSKRTGTYVTLDELVDEVGCDAARYFFVTRSADSLIDFDMDLAKSQSAENPVYYIQYAHARICSILAQGGHPESKIDATLLNSESELALIRRLADFPDEVAAAAKNREPHRVAAYTLELAGLFHNFYNHCHCILEDKALMNARLALCQTTGQVLRIALGALGVSAPEKM